MENENPTKTPPDAFDVGPKSNPHADLAESPFTPGETEGFRRDLAEAIPISGVDVAGLGDLLVNEDMPVWAARELSLYVEHRITPSSLIRKMLEDDLSSAVEVATVTNVLDMPILAYWIWRYAPRESFGSSEAVEAWIAGK